MGRAPGCGLHHTSILHPTSHPGLEDHLLVPAVGSLLWETGLLVSVSSQGRRCCPPRRDMGPLGPGRLVVAPRPGGSSPLFSTSSLIMGTWGDVFLSLLHRECSQWNVVEVHGHHDVYRFQAWPMSIPCAVLQLSLLPSPVSPEATWSRGSKAT